MKRAEIRGYELDQSTHPCGRLVRKGDYDAQRQVMSFDLPSGSRSKKVWGCELHCATGQFACDCEQFRPYPHEKHGPYRNMRNGAYRDEVHGAFLEHLYDIHPLITRKPSGLCPHGKKVREYLKRHRLENGRRFYDVIAEVVGVWEKDAIDNRILAEKAREENAA